VRTLTVHPHPAFPGQTSVTLHPGVYQLADDGTVTTRAQLNGMDLVVCRIEIGEEKA
jgi:hypothetical protein